ncbi:MAG: helix-turn-helix domain-containing protein [Bacteroidota bacterium]
MARSLDVWSVFIIISLAHSLFALNLLLIKKEHKTDSGKWLIFILVSQFWFQLEFLSIRWPYDVGINIFYGTRFGAWFLVGPLFYGYISSVTTDSFSAKKLYYFSPFILFSILLPLIFGDLLSYRQVHYGMLTPFDNRPDQINFVQYIYSGVFITQFLYFGYFLYRSKNEIDQYAHGLKNEFSNTVNQLKWLKMMWYGMSLILVLVTLFIVILFFFFTSIYRRHMDYLYVLPISILVYIVSYKLSGVSWVQPETKLKYEKSGFQTSEIESLKAKIYKNLKANKLYLNQELRLKDLAEELEMRPHHLSELLNQHMSITFFDLINRYRVEEAKNQMLSNPHYTLLQIAFESGFNNKTSFVNAFKRFEGMTPSDYMKKMT